MKYVITGSPRTKKSHIRIVRIRGRPVPIQAKANAAWGKMATEQLQVQNVGNPAISIPVAVRATFYREKRLGDLVNFMQALADALEGAGVVENDRLVESWDGTRMDVDRENPRVELEVTPL